MSGAILGYGTLFQTESLISSGVWVTTAEVRSIKPPTTGRDALDLTHEHAPDEWVESMPGMRRGGEMTLELNFVPGDTTWDDLNAELDDNEVRSRRLVFPNGMTMAFNAYLKGLSPEVPVDGAMSATADFVVSGRSGVIS